MDKKKLIFGVSAAVVIVLLAFVYFTFFRTYTVTYTLKIGPGIPAEQVRKGSTAKEPVKPTAEGYNFLGWYLDGELYDFSKPVTSDITLVAKWEKVHLQ